MSKASKFEFRSFNGEVRFDQEKRQIVGRIPFNKEAVVAGLFREVVRSSFFNRAIEEGDDIVAWAEHGQGHLPFARTANGSLTLIPHEDHLEWRAAPVEAEDVNNLIARIEGGVMTGTSFMFLADDNDPDEVKWDRSERDKLPLRELRKAKRVVDVSPVTFPVYGGTSVGLRSELRSAESVYREWEDSVGIQEDSTEDRGESEVQESRDMTGVIDLILNF